MMCVAIMCMLMFMRERKQEKNKLDWQTLDKINKKAKNFSGLGVELVKSHIKSNLLVRFIQISSPNSQMLSRVFMHPPLAKAPWLNIDTSCHLTQH